MIASFFGKKETPTTNPKKTSSSSSSSFQLPAKPKTKPLARTATQASLKPDEEKKAQKTLVQARKCPRADRACFNAVMLQIRCGSWYPEICPTHKTQMNLFVSQTPVDSPFADRLEPVYLKLREMLPAIHQNLADLNDKVPTDGPGAFYEQAIALAVADGALTSKHSKLCIDLDADAVILFSCANLKTAEAVELSAVLRGRINKPTPADLVKPLITLIRYLNERQMERVPKLQDLFDRGCQLFADSARKQFLF